MRRGEREREWMRSPNDDEEGENWILSYSDLMTLLFAFFALLISFSEVDPVRMQIVVNSLQKSIKGAAVEERITLSQIQEDLETLVAEQGLSEQVSVNRDQHGVSLSLLGSSFFASGSAQLLPEVEGFLTKIAREIEWVPYQIAIEGHTDDIPIASAQYPSNWELSSARASMVVNFFIGEGLSADRFRAVGYADTRPVDPNLGNATPEARAQNRRVVISFLDVSQ